MTADELDALWKDRARYCSHQPGLMYLTDHEKSLVETGYVEARRIAHLEHIAEMKAYKDDVTELLNKVKKELDRLDTLADRIGNNEIING